MSEFHIKGTGNDWLVVWAGCDGRSVARCFNRYEAAQIAKALNETGAAARWYRRARTALGMAQEARTIR